MGSDAEDRKRETNVRRAREGRLCSQRGIKGMEEREYITKKKKLKERGSYVEYFYIISEGIFFLPLCLCL
jgi:hypothetical protein